MKPWFAIFLLLCEIAFARPNCPSDLRNELPFATASHLAVERWSRQEFRLNSNNVEVIAFIAGDSNHFRPMCEKQISNAKFNQGRYLSIWLRSNTGWNQVAQSDNTLVAWDQVGEFTTQLRWDRSTLIVEESGHATRLAMEYTTRLRPTKDGHSWQVIGQDSTDLYNEYRISSKEAQDDFDKTAQKHPTSSPFSGHKYSINWLTGKASIECHSFGEVPKARVVKFTLDTPLHFGDKSSDQRAATIYQQLKCK